MRMQAGLAFEQAPPFALPLRFFLSAPLFLLAAGVLLAVAPDALGSRWGLRTFALTHLVTLGFLGMTMLGALTQMLPVLAGVPIAAPRAVAWLTHAPFTLGSALLVAAFLGAGAAAFTAAIALLGAGLAVFGIAAATSLARAARGDTVNGMRLALAGLALTATFGVALALPRAGWLPRPPGWVHVDAHAAFGLLGWVLLLVIGIAYQVVPMFQITPPYPRRIARWLAFVLAALLGLYAFAPWLPAPLTYAAEAGIAAVVLVFALVTLRLQTQRRRKLPDVTLDFWRLGMASLIACVGVWLAARLLPAGAARDALSLLLGVLFLAGFAVSVVSGMLYKIVPFLAWFHLQAQLQARAGTIPTMKDMIDPRRQRMQLRLHLAACALLVPAPFWPPLAIGGGLVLCLSAASLWLNLLSAVRRFHACGGRAA